jgi:hypothetical protein
MNAKQAEVARRRRSQAEVERLIGEYEASGLGRLEFCAKHGLSLSTLNRHRKRRQLRSEGATSARLVAVECSAAKQTRACRPGSELSVLLSSGRRIEVRGEFDPKLLQELVRVLEQV